jgi:putative SOS response-associated peptidase YedK
MCGIATNSKPKKAIEDRFSAKIKNEDYSAVVIAKAFANDELPIITQNNPTEITMMEWGLIPEWARGAQEIKKLRSQTINARSETIFEKPSFREGIVRKRCLVIVDGFIEYQHRGKEKQAYYIQLQHNSLFAMAGIYSEWKDEKTKEKCNSFSIITVPANAMMAEIHNSKKRMPLILHRVDEQDWLQENDIAAMQKFFKPFPDKLMKAHEIDNKIGKQTADKKDITLLNKYNAIVQGSLF